MDRIPIMQENNHVQRTAATLCSSPKCSSSGSHPVLTRIEKTKSKDKNNNERKSPHKYTSHRETSPLPPGLLFQHHPYCSLPYRLQGWRKPQVRLTSVSCASSTQQHSRSSGCCEKIPGKANEILCKYDANVYWILSRFHIKKTQEYNYLCALSYWSVSHM